MILLLASCLLDVVLHLVKSLIFTMCPSDVLKAVSALLAPQGVLSKDDGFWVVAWACAISVIALCCAKESDQTPAPIRHP